VAKLHVELPDKGGPAVIEIDGVDIANGVAGLCLTDDAYTRSPVLELTLATFSEIDADGDVRILIPNATRAALIALGWTPPEE
jgi:hypothetical protein